MISWASEEIEVVILSAGAPHLRDGVEGALY
jgi:hypothetical protein